MQRHVAVDVGGSMVRAAEIGTDKKGRVSILSTAATPLPAGVVHGGIVDSPGELAIALKSLWSVGKFKTKDVAFSMANPAVTVRKVDVDWRDPKYFRQTLRYDLPSGMLLEDRSYELDFHMLDEYQRSEPDGSTSRRCIVLVVAAETDMVEQFIAAVTGAGLRPIRADHQAFALARGAVARASATRGAVELLVDIGAHSALFVIHRDGQPLFVRGVPGRGGGVLTDRLVEQFGWTVQDAEQAKRALTASGALQVAAGPNVFGGGDPAASDQHPAQPVVDHHVAELIHEVRSSLDWFLTNMSSIDSVDEVILSGGGSLLNGLAQRLAGELHIPVTFADPFAALKLKTDLPDGAAAWAATVGLAQGVN